MVGTQLRESEGGGSKFLERAQDDPRFQVVDVNLKFNKPELIIEIDRDKARATGVTVRDIAEALQLYFSGQRYGFFIYNGKQYSVIGQAVRHFRDDPSDITGIMVRNDKGNMVELGNLITLPRRAPRPSDTVTIGMFRPHSGHPQYLG